MEAGNAKKMLEALRKINSLCGIGVVEVSSFEIGSICDSALSAPPRNCDVGTVEEQKERYVEYCNQHYHGHSDAECDGCPLWTSGRFGSDCQLDWAQLPYDEAQEEGKQ